jgi:hypothetical protein
MQTFSELHIGKYVGVWDAIGVQFLHLFPHLATSLDTDWVEKVRVGFRSKSVELIWGPEGRRSFWKALASEELVLCYSLAEGVLKIDSLQRVILQPGHSEVGGGDA